MNDHHNRVGEEGRKGRRVGGGREEVGAAWPTQAQPTDLGPLTFPEIQSCLPECTDFLLTTRVCSVRFFLSVFSAYLSLFPAFPAPPPPDPFQTPAA